MYSSTQNSLQTKPLPGYTGYRPQYQDEPQLFSIPNSQNQSASRIPGKRLTQSKLTLTYKSFLF